MTINSLDALMDILSSCKGHYGVRGLSGYNATVNYSVGDILAPSFDLDEQRGVEYDQDADLLSGTSGFAVDYYMYDDDVAKAVERAKNYSDGRVILINSRTWEDGQDNGEKLFIDAEYIGEINI